MAKQYWKPGNMLYPVPAVMVTCQRKGEQPNIITIAWTGTVCSDPPMVSVSIQKKRYSYAIIKEKISCSHRLLRCSFRPGYG